MGVYPWEKFRVERRWCLLVRVAGQGNENSWGVVWIWAEIPVLWPWVYCDLGQVTSAAFSHGALVLVPCHASLLPGRLFSSPYLESTSLSPVSCYCLLKLGSLISNHPEESLSWPPSVGQALPFYTLSTTYLQFYIYLCDNLICVSLLDYKPWDLCYKKADQFVFPIVFQPQHKHYTWHSSCMNSRGHIYKQQQGQGRHSKIGCIPACGFLEDTVILIINSLPCTNGLTRFCFLPEPWQYDYLLSASYICQAPAIASCLALI